MIFHIAILPEAVEQLATNHEGLTQFKMLMDDVRKKGRVYVDRDERLKIALFQQIQALTSTGSGPKVKVLFAEIGKKPGKIVTSNKSSVSGSLYRVLSKLANSEEVDGIVVNEKVLNNLKRDDEDLSERAFLPSQYGISAVYDLLETFEEKENLEGMTLEEFTYLFKRLTRHTKTLKIFDRYVDEDCLQSIKLIAEQWKRSDYFNKDQSTIELYTVTKVRFSQDWEKTKQKEAELLKEDCIKIKKTLLDPLSSALGVPVILKVKRNITGGEWNKYHARFMRAGNISVNVERGFDFYRSPSADAKTPFINCFIHVSTAKGDNDYLDSWEALEDFLSFSSSNT